MEQKFSIQFMLAFLPPDTHIWKDGLKLDSEEPINMFCSARKKFSSTLFQDLGLSIVILQDMKNVYRIYS